MLVLLFVPIFYVVAWAYRYLQLFAPSNLVMARVRRSRPRWRTVVKLAILTAIILVVMHLVGEAVVAGAPGWLNVVVLILIWDALKLGGLAVHELARTAFRGLAG